MDIKGERGRLGKTGAEIDTCKLLEVIMLSLTIGCIFCYCYLLCSFINTVLNFIVDFVSHFSNKTLFRLHQDPD